MSEMALQLIRRAKEEGWKRLDLGNTGIIGAVPGEVGELDELEELILSEEWWEWSDNASNWTKNRTNNIGPRNQINLLPNTLPTNLEKLIICGNPIASIRPLKNLTNLEYLDCSKTEIFEITSLASLRNIIDLYLSHTQIFDLRPITSLSQLETFDCSQSNISDLSPLQDHKNLANLYFANTIVNDLSPLKSIVSLETLDCSNTLVGDLEPIKNLISLEYLYCDNTLIHDIGPISNLSNLHTLEVSIDSLEFPPRDILELGTRAILDYLRQHEKNILANLNPQPNWWLKWVIVGNSHAGKSSLLESWKSGKPTYAKDSTTWLGYENWEWTEPIELARPKSPGNSELHTVEGKPILRIFDFGGQDYYHDAHHLFFSSDTAYVVLWDQKQNQIGEVNDNDGLLHFNYPIQYWLDAIRYHCQEKKVEIDHLLPQSLQDNERHGKYSDNVPAVNKKKKPDDWNENLKPQLKGVSLNIHALILQGRVDEAGRQFLPNDKLKKQFPWIYDFDAVSLNPDKPFRLDVTLTKFKEMIQRIDLLGSPFLATWLWIRDALADREGGDQKQTVFQFVRWANSIIRSNAKNAGIQKAKIETIILSLSDAPSILKYLSSLGLVLHYPDVPELKDTVFLHPENLRNELVEILKGLKESQGYFNENYVRNKSTKTTNPDHAAKLLSLMQQFKMAFKLPSINKGVESWVAPLYLPKDPPAGVKLLMEVFERPVCRIVYPYFIHKSVILELFKEYSEHLVAQEGGQGKQQEYIIWRHGMVIQVPHTQELVMVKFFMGQAAKEEKEDNNEQASTQSEENKAKEAYIEVYSFKTPQGAQPAQLVMQKLGEINTYWHTREEVTLDGKTFVPIEVLKKASAEKQVHFPYKERSFALEDFAQYVEIPWSRIFISYAEEDEAYCTALEKHLGPLRNREKIALWGKGQLKPGMEKDLVQQQELRRADIVILLLSADYFSDRDIWYGEMKEVLERHQRGECRIAYLQARRCDVGSTEFENLVPLLKTPVGNPSNDELWQDAVQKLKGMIQSRKGENR